MGQQSYIRSVIGDQRTLVITCLECCFDIEQRGHGNAFRYTSLANVLNPEDKLQCEAVRGFVDFKACSQIIVAGHYGCRALEYILNNDVGESPVKTLQPQLQQLAECNHLGLIRPDIRKNAAVELNVLHQCETIMKMFDFQKRVANGKLTIRGIVVDNNFTSNKEIFHNGYSFNHLISVN